ncbi:MAG: hypothetical protein ACI4QY_00045 [Oscillospiraceae bacterium]
MKKYPIGRVIVSFIIMLSLPLASLISLGCVGLAFEERSFSEYDLRDLYTYQVTGHSVEKLNDKLCLITLHIKNDSAYVAELHDYDFTIEAGGNRVSNVCDEMFETNVGYHRQALVIPAGRTVDAHFRVPVTNSITSVVFSYTGYSYKYKDLFDLDGERLNYLVEVDLR